MDKKNNLLGQPTINNRTLLNRPGMALDSLIPKQNNDEIPTLLGSSPSLLNIEHLQIAEEPIFVNPDNYFRQVLNPNLLCYKCKKLYTDPIACYKCNKVYCFNCLEWELNVHSRCLYCFNIIFKEIAEKVKEDIEEEYEKHEVKCPYKKCKEIKRLKEIREHIEECLYKDNDAFKIEHIEKVVCFSNDVS